MAWRLFRWGSRGEWYETDVPGVYTMAHIFIHDGIRVVIQGLGLEAQEYLNVIGVQVPTGPPSYADCVAVANAVAGWWNTNYRNMVPATTSLVQVVATSLASAPGPQAIATSTSPGLRTGTQLTSDITMCLKLATNASGRRNRGRFYAWPAVTTDLQSPDFFTAAYRTAMVGVLANLQVAIAGAGYAMAVTSYTDAAMKPITHIVAVDNVVDAQRRRLPLRGR